MRRFVFRMAVPIFRRPRAPAFYAQPSALRNRMQGLSAPHALLRRSTASAGRILVERMIEPECVKVFLRFFLRCLSTIGFLGGRRHQSSRPVGLRIPILSIKKHPVLVLG